MPDSDSKVDEQSIAGRGITFTLIHAVLAASIGSGFQHGYNTGVINAPQKVITNWMNETFQTDEFTLQLAWSTTTSIICIGGIIGGALTGVLAGKCGRRNSLIINNGLAILAGVIMGCAKYTNPWLLIVGRLIVGINAGLNAAIAPMYLSEIAPIRLRGAIGSMYQLVITISILIAQLVSMEKVLGTDELWPILLYAIILPAIYQIIALKLAPESPKYLLEKNNEAKALSACERLGGDIHGKANFLAVKNEINEEKNRDVVTFKDMWTTGIYRRPLIIMCILMATQQLSGINAVIYYSTTIFKSASFDESGAQLATVGVGIVNVITTIVSVFLVEMVGRKPLLIIGFGGMAIVTTLIMVTLMFVEKHEALAFLAIVLVYIYIVLFASGAGSIPWILGSELFTTAARPKAISVAVPVSWLSNFVVAVTFLLIEGAIGPFVFLIFIASNIGATLYFLFLVPETKNKPIEEITALFEDKRK